MQIFHERFEFLKARQALEKHYALNGAIYLTDVEHLMSRSDIYEKECYAYYMPPERSFDIDSQLDFDWCEFYLNNMK